MTAFAASLNKRFAPMVYRRVPEKEVPEALAKLNFIFFDDVSQFEHSADQLTQALKTGIGSVRQHTEFGEQARRWVAASEPSGLLLRSPVLEQAERWIAARRSGAPLLEISRCDPPFRYRYTFSPASRGTSA